MVEAVEVEVEVKEEMESSEVAEAVVHHEDLEEEDTLTEAEENSAVVMDVAASEAEVVLMPRPSQTKALPVRSLHAAAAGSAIPVAVGAIRRTISKRLTCVFRMPPAYLASLSPVSTTNNSSSKCLARASLTRRRLQRTDKSTRQKICWK